jgi:hypothetical protein
MTLALMLSGCNNHHNVKSIDFTEQSRTVSIENKDLYRSELLTLIQSGEAQGICKDDFEFDSYDIIENAEVKQCYYFNGSIYLQISDEYMYRFQIDTTDNKIESYVKYTLEA